MTTIIFSVLVIAVLGIIFGVGLSVAAKKLAVPVDERVEQIREYLPGANCGGCGFPGCDGFAEAVVNGSAKPNGCLVCSAENAAKIGEIMGMAVETGSRKVARVVCQGGNGVCGNKGDYKGAKDCRSASIVAGGFRNCSVACLGLGTCVSVCKFGAIKVGEDGVAHVNEKACVGCGACVDNCPVGSIMLVPEDAPAYIMCHNPQKGKPVLSVCSNGCIGCTLCSKMCPEGAIEIVNNLPVFDYDKCKGCGICASKCKPGAIMLKNPPVEQEETVA